MALTRDLMVGEGVRIDATDIWLLKEIIEDGTAAVMFDPAGKEVTLRQDVAYRVGPGFRLSVAAIDAPAHIRLVIDAYIPLVHLYPPRTGKPVVKMPKGAGS